MADLPKDPILRPQIRSGLTTIEQLVIHHVDGSVRAVGLRDRRRAERERWLASWIKVDQAFQYEHQNTRILSQVYAPFDTLLLHGEDCRRMSRIVREWRDVLGSKTIIAALPQPDTDDRIELFKAGADTVVDVLADPAIAAAAVQAVLRRTRSLAKRWLNRPQCLADLKTHSKLSRTEQEILDAIFQRKGEPVRREVVLARLGKAMGDNTARTLRVQIHFLNQKLINARVKTMWKTGLVIEPFQPSIKRK
jgi:DNA-binding response OmpR family regulator